MLRRWLIGIASFLLTLMLLAIVMIQGYVSGQEFSPTHFQQRDFSFYEIPLIHLQITPIRRSGSTPATAVYIRQNSFIKNYTGVPHTWHLVSISRGLTGSTDANAKLLLDPLKFQQAGSAYWRQWTIDHAKHGHILWPVIQMLAQRELYILMPELFELAQLGQTPEQFDSNMNRFLQDQYLRLVQDMKAAGRAELAGQLLDEALSDFPDDPPLNKLRQEMRPNPTQK